MKRRYQHRHICPICNHEYKYLLTHIQINANDHIKEYEQLFDNLCEKAKQLYYDNNYNVQAHESYNLNVNYLEITFIWYKILNLPKRKIQKSKYSVDKRKCPFCNRIYGLSTFNQHLKCIHPEEYKQQVELVKQLFNDYNFSANTIDTYTNVYLTMGCIYKIWKNTYDKKTCMERGKKCNAYHNSIIKKGTKVSDKTKKKLSVIQSTIRQNQSHQQYYNNFIAGYRPDIDLFVHSTWEANLCRIFQYEKKNYIYETTHNTFQLTFPDGTIHNYIIDFCDVDGLFTIPGTFIELKGHMDDKSKQKIESFKEQYPQHKLITIGTNIKEYNYDILYSLIQQKYQAKIPLWETIHDNIKTNPNKWSINNMNVVNNIPVSTKTMNCPICGEISGVRMLTHIKHYHPELLSKLEQQARILFYDKNFTQQNASKYKDVIYNVSYTSIYRYWDQLFGPEIASQRFKIIQEKKT